MRESRAEAGQWQADVPQRAAQAERRERQHDREAEDVVRRDAGVPQVGERPVVGRGPRRGREVDRLDGVARRDPGGKRLDEWTVRDHRGAEVPGGVRPGDRRRSEDVRHHARVALDEPRLAVVVVHHEYAVGREVIPSAGEGFLGEEERLEPQIGCAAHQREGIGHREHDEVIPFGRVPQERATIGDDRRDARVGVRVVGVLRPPDRLDAGVDLDRVHGPGPVRQGDRNIGPRAGADDQRLREGAIGKPAIDLVVVGLLRRRRGEHRLERQAVDEDDIGPRRAHDVEPVVGRVHVPADRFDAEADHGRADECRHSDGSLPAAGSPERQQRHEEAGDREPDARRQSGEGHPGEQRDPGHRAGDVERVRTQWWHRAEEGTQRDREEGHRDRRQDEQTREDDEVDVQPAALAGREPDIARLVPDVDLGERHEDDDRECARGEPGGRPRVDPPPEENADPDT